MQSGDYYVNIAIKNARDRRIEDGTPHRSGAVAVGSVPVPDRFWRTERPIIIEVGNDRIVLYIGSVGGLRDLLREDARASVCVCVFCYYQTSEAITFAHELYSGGRRCDACVNTSLKVNMGSAPDQ